MPQRKSHCRHLIPSLLLSLSFPAILAAQPVEEPAPPAATTISPVSVSLAAAGPLVQQYDQHISTLANPFFEGRAPGLRGNSLAAEYVEFHFRRLGLQPAFSDNPQAGSEGSIPAPTYRQTFSVGSTLRVTERSAAFAAPGGEEQSLVPLEDFTVHEYSASGQVSGPVAFVGYSIQHGQDDYNTFPPIDDSRELLKGKIALILRFEPMTAEGKSRWIEERWSLNADLTGKMQSAASRGAAAIILVTPANAADPRAGEIKDAEGARSTGFEAEIPVFMFTPDAADRLIRAGDLEGRSLADLQALADESGGVIDLPNVTASLKAGIEDSPVRTDNIGAVLPGKGDLADQYIVIGAHYDHVGYGFGGDGPVHPGADDNASGTSGVLLLADLIGRDYAALPEDASARSVLFLAFSAEEIGLVGSRHYVDHPSIPADKMFLMLNMDMIGRLREDHLEVGGVGTGEGLEAFLRPYFDASGMSITPSSVGDDRSDHASFRSVGVPALFFFTGLHEDYHQPGDFAWKINREGAVRVVELVRQIAVASAQRREAFPFSETVLSRGRPSRVMLGVQAAEEPSPEGGFVIGSITPGSAADEAGLKPGDRITTLGGQPLPGPDQIRSILREFEPGDVVEIVYIRDGQEATASATLKARSQGG
jgi:hypothetical protein